MSKPVDLDLYQRAKATANLKYKKPSAYKSGFIVQEYKRLGGKYEGRKKEVGLTRWFAEDWQDVGGSAYPVFRPTRRVSAQTPLTVSEINPENLKKQIALKQRIRGEKNLPPFEARQSVGDSRRFAS
jgi:hypothetical protein